MSLSNTINYNTAANFTYNTSLVEILTSAKLKLLTYAGETFFNNFTSTTAKRGAGTLAPTAATASIVAGKLACLSNTYVEYPCGDNTAFTTTGCVRFKLTPNYSGTPSTNQFFFSIQEAGSSLVNSISIYHNTGGSLILGIYNASGVAVVSKFMAWSPTSGTQYTMHLNFDIVTGSSILYIDGVAIVTATDTGTRANTATRLMIGRQSTATSSNFYMDDLQLFSSVQTVAASWSEPVDYTTTAQLVLVNSSVDADALSSFDASTGISFTIVVDGVHKYWDGAAWVTSDGATQYNSISEVNTNIAALDISVGVSFKIGAFLVSSDGYSTPELLIATTEYDYFKFAVTVDFCTIVGYIYDSGTAVSGAVIQFITKDAQVINNNLIKISKQATTNANGYFEIDLPETATNAQKVLVKISYTNALGNKDGYTRTIIIPNQATADFDDLIVAA